MTKIVLNVPNEVRYLTEWEGFTMPEGIFNKMLTGCGGSEWWLRQKETNVLCSPRIKLIENKHAQHPDDTVLVCGKITPEQIIAEIESKRANGIEHVHILCTFDAITKVITALGDEVSQCNLLIDEFQLVLTDASFKSEVELKLLSKLNAFHKVTLMSATPLLDEVVSQMPELKDMPYTELQFDKTEKIKLHRIRCAQPKSAALEIVRQYQAGAYPVITDNDNVTATSTEAVIFVNSVQTIMNIVLQAKLSPDDVNIMIGNSSENDRLLAKLSEKMGQTYINGQAPLEGEPHKMITLCTSTCYAGVDFYSPCATTFVISDCHQGNTSVGIDYELPQIAGRQRLEANPFRKVVYLIYNMCSADMNDEQFENAMAEKLSLTQQEIENDNLTEGRLRTKRIYERQKEQKAVYYSNTWNIYDKDADEFKLNHLKMLSERHAFHVQKQIYQEGLLVTELEKSGRLELGNEEEYAVIDEKLQNLIQRTTFEDLMRRYCEYREDPLHHFDLLAKDIEREHPEIKAFYDVLGYECCSACIYRKAYLEEQILNRKNHYSVLKAYVEAFPVGTSLSTADFRNRITELNTEYSLLYRGKPRKGKIKNLITQYGFEIKKDRKSGEYVVLNVPDVNNLNSTL